MQGNGSKFSPWENGVGNCSCGQGNAYESRPHCFLTPTHTNAAASCAFEKCFREKVVSVGLVWLPGKDPKGLNTPQHYLLQKY